MILVDLVPSHKLSQMQEELLKLVTLLGTSERLLSLVMATSAMATLGTSAVPTPVVETAISASVSRSRKTRRCSLVAAPVAFS
jgi:hypothetical protein